MGHATSLSSTSFSIFVRLHLEPDVQELHQPSEGLGVAHVLVDQPAEASRHDDYDHQLGPVQHYLVPVRACWPPPKLPLAIPRPAIGKILFLDGFDVDPIV